MSKPGYHGPLEQIDECCWRIPAELQAGDAGRGADLRRRAADRADPRRPGARAGGQRGLPAGHPDGQPRHARHPLGLRLLHRRRLGHRSGRRRRDLAGRRGLRHQLRRAAGAHEPARTTTSQPRIDAADGRAVSRAFRPAWARAGRTCSAARNCGGCWPKASRYLQDARPGHRRRPRAHRGRRLPRRRRARRRQPAGHAARRRPVRHARLGQPLPRSPGRRRDLRRDGRPRRWAWRRAWSA